ncbi:MAG: translation initiation factor IF-3 [bacterium]
MRRTYRKPKPKLEKRFRTNYEIKFEQVFLIDADGVQIGPVPTRKAIAMAEEAELDLVEVNPKANPPIVKIMDYGQFKYEQDKKAQKQKMKSKKSDTKCIRLSVRIGDHDFDFRIDQAKKFLIKGSKLRIELLLKGRERQHVNVGREVVERFVQKLQSDESLNIEIEEALTKQGAKFTITLINKKN